MYVSKIKIVSDPSNELAKTLAKRLEELGYYVVNENPEIYVFFYPLGITVRKILGLIRDKATDPVVISVTDDGSYVIPVIKEHRGGSILGGIIADLMGSQLVLTSRTSQMGIYSVEEFAWMNGLEIDPKVADSLNFKLVKNGKLRFFVEDRLDLKVVEGFEPADRLENADLVIGEECSDLPTLRPKRLVIGLGYSTGVPLEVLYFSIVSTMKSLHVYERRLDFIAVPEIKQGDERIKKIGNMLGASIIYVPLDQIRGRSQSTPSRVARDRFGIDGVCEPSLEALGTRIVLKRTKRAYGVVTCLGVK
ncbi:MULTISPECIES: cobalamin biosynthesis protein [Metallosphaera]|uniref:Cobalamin (Vitamin B12) biosynthesis CbiG protein n=3 Tax=Metallosphaera TaxID=41980 RepID=A4YIH9_METS5|nr:MULTISPECIES: cobalamin biosynthesis protein [Metallosphaera]ABP96231.1 cobalamin (vitamin B12) biosynthesis CbiG protein [Metallosphaera sedula DSM 5348]AIM28214.1 cobalamin (vitamin B12) biosynthesis CbiG protein [Metallosphaera sedula]AKV75025.1 cobalamin biosynthesis protein CbiG [Metallosphaera sedula]AKV77263.1 cobalamin biosynthesis protein CbiG [Metallosphaera sedula]AKV79513.1 cobalamin biosynthesis protein CbiG [Metallosphaera sedula]